MRIPRVNVENMRIDINRLLPFFYEEYIKLLSQLSKSNILKVHSTLVNIEPGQ